MNSSGESTFEAAFCTVSGAQATSSWTDSVPAGATFAFDAKPRAACGNWPCRMSARACVRVTGPEDAGGVVVTGTGVGAAVGTAATAVGDGLAGVALGTVCEGTGGRSTRVVAGGTAAPGAARR